VSWTPRQEPLAPRAVAAWGPAARALARRALGRRLDGVAGDDLLVLLGEADALPWADGAVYLGRDERAPSLLLPTALEPDVPVELFERALLARHPETPLAVFDRWIVPVGAARPVERDRLAAWLAR
jgi:hypothetical protein